MTPSELPVVERFRADLLTATPARRRRRGPAALAAALAAAAAALGAPLVAGGPALAVQEGGGVLELRIEDPEASAAELTRALRDAGVAGEVRTVAAAPGEVGRWLAWSETAGCVDPPVVRLGAVRLEGDALLVPVDRVRESTGRFTFYAGRAPAPGEAVRDVRAAIEADAGPPPPTLDDARC